MRRAFVVTVLAFVLTALAWPAADARYLGSDVMGNVAPSSATGGLADKYPLSAYSLDSHVDVGVADLDGVPPTIAQWASSQVWMVTAWAIKLVLDVFGWAFSLDLLSGPRGALGPVGRATRTVYDNVIGRTWMMAAFSFAALWAIWKGLAQRKYSEMYTGLAISAICVIVGWFFIYEPQQSIGTAADWSNQMSTAFLSATNRGNVTDGNQAKRDISDHLFEVLVYRPWVVLEFGGVRHCVNTDRPDGHGYPMPVGPNDPSRTVCRDHITPNGAGYGGYARWFLEAPYASDDRDRAYKALRDGEMPPHSVDGLYRGAAPPVDPLRGAKVDKSDSPAVDIQQAGGAYQRLALTALIALGAFGAILFLGFIALAIVLAQVLALVLLAFAPIALLVGIFPGAGHAFFRNWLGRLGVAIFIKALYSLILGIVVIVSSGLADATTTMPFGIAYGLQAGFFWALLLYRKKMWAMASRAAVGTRMDRETNVVMRRGEEAARAPLATLAGAATVRGHRSVADGFELRRKRDDKEEVKKEAVTDVTASGTKKFVDSSSPPASAGRTYSPPGPPPTQNGHVTVNGHQPDSEEDLVVGNRVPPRVNKTHIHANGQETRPETPGVTYDPDRDTSNRPRVPVNIRDPRTGASAPVRVMDDWPDIASAHAVDERPSIPRVADTPLRRSFERDPR